MIDGGELSHRSACGYADKVRGIQFIGVEHCNCVVDEVVAGVAGVARRIGGRETGVAVVVADYEPAGLRERAAEVLRPPEHGSAGAHDEQDRRLRSARRSRAGPTARRGS